METETRGFTREAVHALSVLNNEPDWLRQRRLEAWEVFERTPMPDSRHDEEWRRTNLSGLHLDELLPFAAPQNAAPDGPDATVGELAEGRSALVVQDDRAAARLTVSEELTRQGVLLMDLHRAAHERPDLLRQYFMTDCVPATYSKFAALHGAFWTGGILVYVPRNVAVTLPIQSILTQYASGTTLAAHTLIIAEPGSSITYIDEGLAASFAGIGTSDPLAQSLCSNVVEIYAKENSTVRYVNLQEWGPATYSFSTQRVLAERDSKVNWLFVALGSQLGKANLDSVLRGPGADVEMLGLIFGDGHQVLDCHTMQDHVAPNTRSDLLYKGVLKEHAHSIFSGLIRVFPHAQKTDAYQQNRNLLLSPTARADSIPNLEIGANDVRCTHAATVGQVEDEYLFYLMSRGLPRAVAERMIVEGFFEPVLQRIPLEDLRERLAAYIQRKMER